MKLLTLAILTLAFVCVSCNESCNKKTEAPFTISPEGKNPPNFTLENLNPLAQQHHDDLKKEEELNELTKHLTLPEKERFFALLKEENRSMEELVKLFPEKDQAPLKEFLLGEKKYSIDLHSEKGKYILLDFFASWCEPCKENVPHMNEVYNKYGSKALIIGIGANDDQANIETSIKEWGIKYPVVYMPSDKLSEFGQLRFPTIFLINPDGTVKKKYTGITKSIIKDIEQFLHLSLDFKDETDH